LAPFPYSTIGLVPLIIYIFSSYLFRDLRKQFYEGYSSKVTSTRTARSSRKLRDLLPDPYFNPLHSHSGPVFYHVLQTFSVSALPLTTPPFFQSFEYPCLFSDRFPFLTSPSQKTLVTANSDCLSLPFFYSSFFYRTPFRPT